MDAGTADRKFHLDINSMISCVPIFKLEGEASEEQSTSLASVGGILTSAQAPRLSPDYLLGTQHEIVGNSLRFGYARFGLDASKK